MAESNNVLAWDDPFSDLATAALIESIAAANSGAEAREAIHQLFDPWVKAARTLAARAAQPAAGTHAYELIAAAETTNVQVTETLIHMIAATVLMKADGRYVTFSPADTDEMHRRYEMTATRDGLNTTVRITPRDQALPSLAVEPGVDDAPAKPQAAEHHFDRPVWAVRIGTTLISAFDRADAEMAQAMHGPTATVENRFCLHLDCPSSHCNHPEVTSV